MTPSSDLDPLFRRLAGAVRGLRRVRLAWGAGAAVAAAGCVLLAWEGGEPTGTARAAAYGAALLAGGIGAILWLGRWTRPALAPAELAARLERLYPQTRGALRDALGDSPPGLAAVRAASGRAWVTGRGDARLEAALVADERRAARMWRRSAFGLAVLAAALAVGRPAAARRVADAVASPGALWRGGVGTWRVVPGNAEIEHGGAVVGVARFEGPPATGVLVLESRAGSAGWRADTLAAAPAGRWRWPGVTEPLRYRLRYGPYVSATYRVVVAAPLALRDVEARLPGEPWAPLAGRSLIAGTTFEVRGLATRPLSSAEIRTESGGRQPLAVRGAAIGGRTRLAPGRAELWARGASGAFARGAAFTVVGAGRAYVEIIRPADDPFPLAATGAWIEAHAGSPGGLIDLRWQTLDGLEGVLGSAAGARDTTLAGVAGLGAGREPGDTVRYRVVARPVSGAPAATPWRRAVVAAPAVFRAAAAEERRRAAEDVARAVADAREVAQAASAEGAAARADAQAADRRLQTSADSLGRALERTLADPGLDPDLAERLAGLRRVLEGAGRAPLAPAASLPPDPAAAAAARAAILEAARRELEAVERLLAKAAAADTLEELAAAQSALARQTASAEPAELAEQVAPRQDALAEAARGPTEALADSTGAAVGEALAEAGREVRRGDPARAAGAQQQAAGTMAGAAREAREEVARAAAERAARRAALDRAGAETLFLAERERDLADRMARPPAGAGDHAERIARHQVVARGLEATLGALVAGIGGRPAGAELAERLAQAVFATRYAEDRVARGARGPAAGDGPSQAVEDAAGALGTLARAFLLPSADGSGSGPGAAGQADALARQMGQLGQAEQAIADAVGEGGEEAGGNPEAAAAQRDVGRRLDEMREALREQGIDARTVAALAQAVQSAATQLERGLPGARTQTELRALSRRFADLGRMIERVETERRRSETARAFVPSGAPPLPARTTAPRLDPAAALAPWEAVLPRSALAAARAYLERLAEEGVRAPGAER